MDELEQVFDELVGTGVAEVSVGADGMKRYRLTAKGLLELPKVIRALEAIGYEEVTGGTH
jgi:hypothetical protein